MTNYKLSNHAKEDLIRIYIYGTKEFGVRQADKYFNALFECFQTISENPFSFHSVDHIKKGYRRCPCGSDSIYFRINDGIVEIMVIVGKQDLKNIFAE